MLRLKKFRYLAILLIIAVMYFGFISPTITGGSGSSGSSSTGDQTEALSLEEENAQLRSRVAELEAQLQTLQEGGTVPETSLKEFLDSYFVPNPDGKQYRLTTDVKLFTTPNCGGESISPEGLVFLSDQSLPMPEQANGITPKMVYDANGQIYYTPNGVYFEPIY